MEFVRFLDKDGTFLLKQAENYSNLYFPIAGEKGIKSSVTPTLKGDSKLNQNAFLMEPVSIEDLRSSRSGRNFWCHIPGNGTWSAVGESAEEESRKFTSMQDTSEVMAGFMWHTITRNSKHYQLESQITSFVPVDRDVEIMQVEITNCGKIARNVVPTAVIPIYGRSADNIRDHRHVTSLLHRIETTEYGVYVKPTMSFDERGHQKNEMTYFVCGVSGNGETPQGFFPTVDSLLQEGGTFTHPMAILRNEQSQGSGIKVEGKEACGAIQFAPITLKPDETVSYTIIMGATHDQHKIVETIQAFNLKFKVDAALKKVKNYWKEQVNVAVHTGNSDFDNFMQWVSFQPVLRRIYGCSFLPYHDYGKGGRGWRDLWQDCLALLIMNPDGVRDMILSNYGGVRMDGTNATIIGEKQGEFIADRNNITRVWMDHGFWPWMTTKLYMDQTGDLDLLNDEITYFKDKQILRGTGADAQWSLEDGKEQQDAFGNQYKGSVLEHILLENLCAFYEVGEHNYIRLRGADWNDALDMAEKHGESVAFTCAYAGNLKDIASCLRHYINETKHTHVSLLKEIDMLLVDDLSLYADAKKKQELLLAFADTVKHHVSGEKHQVEIEHIAESLEHKADWMMEHIRNNEWIIDTKDDGWFNSYYDNSGNAVEGKTKDGIRMMLTGQVFAIMSQTAKDTAVKSICNSADRYLYEKEIGGYRLNTNFHEMKSDLGRMFGFAYGEKENGAVFSHMTVMYANALYGRNYVHEGYKALQTLADASLHFEKSKIYPGIPEYFNSEGRGMYPYLTGAASWYMLTMVTQVYGVRGKYGNLIIEPKLVKEQFDDNGEATLTLVFAEKKLNICYSNKKRLDYGEYQVTSVTIDEKTKLTASQGHVCMDKEMITCMDEGVHKISVILQ